MVVFFGRRAFRFNLSSAQTGSQKVFPLQSLTQTKLTTTILVMQLKN
jgi:hypothetical protein